MPQYIYEMVGLTTFRREFNFDKNVKEIVSKNTKKYRLEIDITQEQLVIMIWQVVRFCQKIRI